MWFQIITAILGFAVFILGLLNITGLAIWALGLLIFAVSVWGYIVLSGKIPEEK